MTEHIASLPALVNPDLDVLAVTIRRELDEVRRAGCSALRHAMKAGDALNTAQGAVTGNWKRWLRNNCFLSTRTALVYQRLARHRDQIEAAMSGLTAELSLRGALRLIGTPRVKVAPAATEVADTLANHWNRESPQEREAFLDAIGVGGVLNHMSPAFGRALRECVPMKRRAPNQKFKTITLEANPPPPAGEHSRH
jgi:hypothetical protein